VLNLGGETVDTKSAIGKLILTIFAGFSHFEREIMRAGLENLDRSISGLSA
jgi:DNA invertase Pin-like site-specific DNA recombinase